MQRAILLFFALVALILSGCAAPSSSSPGPRQSQTATAQRQTLTPLQPAQLQTLMHMYEYFTEEQCSEGGPQGFEPLPSQGIVLAGENAHTSYLSPGGECAIIDYLYTAGIFFDLSQLGSQPVAQAVLSFRLISSETTASQPRVSCATKLTLATTAWQNYMPGEIDNNAPSFSLPQVDFDGAAQPTPTPGVQIDQFHATIRVDIAPAVNGWLSKRWANDGLLLGPENISGTLACLSRYTDVALAITR